MASLSVAPAPPPACVEAEPEITHSIADFIEPAPLREKPDLRIAPRYAPRRQIGGKFRRRRRRRWWASPNVLDWIRRTRAATAVA